MLYNMVDSLLTRMKIYVRYGHDNKLLNFNLPLLYSLQFALSHPACCLRLTLMVRCVFVAVVEVIQLEYEIRFDDDDKLTIAIQVHSSLSLPLNHPNTRDNSSPSLPQLKTNSNFNHWRSI